MKTNTQISANVVNLRYLYQYSAIPVNIRTAYLSKLLKRSNACDQKNVKLLRLIYSYIEKGTFTSWDDERISCSMNITRNMLYCHKSRLLKGLRKFYFGVDKSLRTSPERTEFDKAVEMNSMGMCREAKVIFLKLEKRLRSKKKKSQNDKYKLLLITRYLYLYYVNTESLKKRQAYLKQGLHLCRSILKRSKPSDDKKILNEVLMFRHYFLAFKSFQNKKKVKGQQNALEHFKLALKPAKKSANHQMHCQTLGNIAYHNIHLKNFEESQRNLNEAFNVAASRKLMSEEILLESIEINCHKRTKKQSEALLRKRFVRLMDKISVNNILPSRKMTIYSNLLPIASTYPSKDVFYKFLHDMNSTGIITYGYKYSFKMLYVSKLLYYSEKLFSIVNVKSPDHEGSFVPVVKGIDKNNFENLRESLTELNINHLNISDLYFQKEVFIHTLMLEVCRGFECNPDNAEYIIRQIEWLNKSRGKIMTEYNNTPFEILKLLSKMIEDFPVLNKDHYLDKYLMRFENSVRTSFDDSHNITLSFKLLSYISTLSGYPEFQKILNNIYPKLYKKYKEYFNYMNNSVMSKKSPEGILI